jgi:hypothetical protein
VLEEFLSAEVVIIGVSTQRSHSTSSERSFSFVCLRVTSPAVNRVGSGGWRQQMLHVDDLIEPRAKKIPLSRLPSFP